MPIHYQDLEGWFDYANLYDDLFFNKLKDNSIFVEIGVWKGCSICYMAELAKENNKNISIYGVDIFSNTLDGISKPYRVQNKESNSYIEFLDNMSKAGVLNRIIPLALFSEDAAQFFDNESIDCVFIDGAHDKYSVTKDLDSWYPKVKIGGYICGHDYVNWIQPIVDEWFKEKINDKVEVFEPSCFIYKKK